MLVIWKGRGMLIPLYVIICVMVISLLAVYLEMYVGGVFIAENTQMFAMGSGFILAGLLAYFSSITHVKKDGIKVRVKANHSLFFIPMNVWAVLLYIFGVVFIAAGIYTYIVTV